MRHRSGKKKAQMHDLPSSHLSPSCSPDTLLSFSHNHASLSIKPIDGTDVYSGLGVMDGLIGNCHRGEQEGLIAKIGLTATAIKFQ
jgi:hypothetical protein